MSSILGMVQNFIGEISGAINSKNNPFGLGPHQIDEINQILTLVKQLISDGVQQSDILNIVTLLGEMVEIIPELQAEIKAIIKALKDVHHQLFDSMESGPDVGMNHFLNPDLNLSSGFLEHAMSLDQDAIESQKPKKKKSGDQGLTPAILEKSLSDRLTIAEQILNIVNNHFVLNHMNMSGLSKSFNVLKNQASKSSSNKETKVNGPDLLI